ncbi:hypothetical protein PtB15_6B871 [Puccinia triticina]|nr:hypothetical protein PtB15_6B871 [Puccinia triticina]
MGKELLCCTCELIAILQLHHLSSSSPSQSEPVTHGQPSVHQPAGANHRRKNNDDFKSIKQCFFPALSMSD